MTPPSASAPVFSTTHVLLHSDLVLPLEHCPVLTVFGPLRFNVPNLTLAKQHNRHNARARQAKQLPGKPYK